MGPHTALEKKVKKNAWCQFNLGTSITGSSKISSFQLVLSEGVSVYDPYNILISLWDHRILKALTHYGSYQLIL
jgi:hypothetical protein